MGEFELIQRYFASLEWRDMDSSSQVLVPSGDDCAVLTPANNHHLAISVDTLIAGVHFPVATAPEDIGHKALAVNLSDLAAMGAEPVWFTLALTLPESNDAWLEAFSRGLFQIAKEHRCLLIGGDTTRGPLSITIQIAGQLPAQQAGPLCRSAARLDDDIYVSGNIGEGAAGLKIVLGDVVAEQAKPLLDRLNRPTPRVELGQALIGHANAAIDLSDGLLADLGHICEQSSVGADLRIDQLPTSTLMRESFNKEDVADMMLRGGDDYELCFTAPVQERTFLEELSVRLDVPLTRVGKVTSADGIRCLDEGGETAAIDDARGYDHFR